MSDTFELNTGGGSPTFSFGPQGSQPGAQVSGTLLDMREVQERNFDTQKPEFWDDGQPKMQLRLTLQTDLRDPAIPHDDGKRDVYLSGYRKPHPKTGTSSTQWAVMEAVRNATGGTQMQRNARLTLQWVSGMGFTGDPRHYVAQYQPPTMDLGGAPQAPAPAFAQPQAAPVAAPVQVPVQPMVAPVAAPVAAPAGPPQPTPEQVAAIRATGMDPRTVFPHYTGS